MQPVTFSFTQAIYTPIKTCLEAGFNKASQLASQVFETLNTPQSRNAAELLYYGGCAGITIYALPLSISAKVACAAATLFGFSVFYALSQIDDNPPVNPPPNNEIESAYATYKATVHDLANEVTQIKESLRDIKLRYIEQNDALKDCNLLVTTNYLIRSIILSYGLPCRPYPARERYEEEADQNATDISSLQRYPLLEEKMVTLFEINQATEKIRAHHEKVKEDVRLYVNRHNSIIRQRWEHITTLRF